MPRALRLGLAIVTLVYVITTLAFMYVIPIEQVGAGEAFVAQVGAVLLGPAGGTIVAGIVVACVLGSLGAMLMLAPRVYFAMARDGLFPGGGGRRSPPVWHPRPRHRRTGAAGLGAGAVRHVRQHRGLLHLRDGRVHRADRGSSLRAAPPRRGLACAGHPWPALIFLGMVAALLVLLAVNNPLQAALGVAVVALGVPVYRARPAAALAPSPTEIRS